MYKPVITPVNSYKYLGVYIAKSLSKGSIYGFAGPVYELKLV